MVWFGLRQLCISIFALISLIAGWLFVNSHVVVVVVVVVVVGIRKVCTTRTIWLDRAPSRGHAYKHKYAEIKSIPAVRAAAGPREVAPERQAASAKSERIDEPSAKHDAMSA